jgi:IS66 C-terminal element/Transposase IS66 family
VLRRAERALRCVAIGRKNYLFAGSDAGGRRAAAIYSLIESAKLNGLKPQRYIADLLARIANHPARRIAELATARRHPCCRLSRPARGALTRFPHF